MRAVLYARTFVTDAFATACLTVQLEQCRTFAAQEGLDVRYEIAEAVTGPLRQRPGGACLAALIEAGEIDTVIVTRYDTISRSVDDLWWFRHRCDEHGIQVRNALEGGAALERGVGQQTTKGRFPS